MHFIDMSCLSLQDRADILSHSYLKNGFWVLFRNITTLFILHALALKYNRKEKDLNHHMDSLTKMSKLYISYRAQK